MMPHRKRSRDADAVTAASKVSTFSSCFELSNGSNDSDDDDDDDDDEVENVMFRPAQTKADDDVATEQDQENVQVRKEKKKKQIVKKQPLSEEDEEMKDEIERKTEATIYVEGISYRANESDLVTHFSSCGAVREVRLARYQDSGKPRGYAHVMFDNETATEKALELDGKHLFGRYLSIRRAETPRAVEMALKEKNQNATKTAVKGCRTVYIKQLPYEVEEDIIREALSSCGTITSVRLPIWKHTQKLKGFGYVEFSSEDEALAAARRSGMKIGDRMVLISLDAAGSAPKSSFRQRDGQYWSKGEEAKKSLAKRISEKRQRQNVHKKRKTARK
ncbi:unnamed protein product [Peronospora belbahrii]|uniref:RRM domain-containing protein n=1 Tax=Peronospora belbahrii TaxID=622444 RepID=A0AAU9LAT7_9STRA|nr:unnamed protein product [Peronospora belbahrii]CAH0517071.1 unnamed protein product [Peronospora belbahrii]